MVEAHVGGGARVLDIAGVCFERDSFVWTEAGKPRASVLSRPL
jgi:hypothetical protein